MDLDSGLLNHPLIAERYFFPRRDAVAEPFWVESAGARLACFVAAPHPDAMTMLHFHGNGEVVGDYVPDMVEAWTQLGVNVFLAEYRGYGQSTKEPLMADQLDDVVEIVAATGVDPSRLVVYGRSVGSIFAIEAAARFEVAGLVIESGISSPIERLLMRMQPAELGVNLQTLKRAASARLDHREKLGSISCPVLVMHALYDGIVDVSHAEQNHAWSASRSKLVLFERGDHNSLIYVNLEKWLEELESFFALVGSV